MKVKLPNGNFFKHSRGKEILEQNGSRKYGLVLAKGVLQAIIFKIAETVYFLTSYIVFLFRSADLKMDTYNLPLVLALLCKVAWASEHFKP